MSILNTCRTEGLFYHHSLDIQAYPEMFCAHFHDMYEILYIIEGKGSFFVEGNNYTVSSGDVFIIRPGETHVMQTENGERYERVAIHFSKNIVRNEFLFTPFNDRKLGCNNKYLQSDVGASANLLSSISDVISGELLLAFVTSRLNAFLCDLFVLHMKSPPSTIREITNPINTVLEYINEHIKERITLCDISSACYISRSQLERLFRSLIGTTVRNYIMQKKLMLAKEFLTNGENAATVCDKCGFGDYSTFYRAYMRFLGTPPTGNPRQERLKNTF